MAQFVTHIQPTLVEASHHHLPHHYKEHKEHKDHDKHHKDYHSKDHHSKDHQDEKKHGKSTKSDHHHRHESNAESLMKDTQVHQGHPREFPVLPHTHPEGHHHDHSHEHQKERKRDSGSYVDSHGNQHTFQLHFVDSQGIHRDYHGHAIDDNHPKDYSDREKHKEKRASVEDKSPLRSISERPTPPKFIDLHSVHSENKISDGNTSFLRAARNGQLEKVLEYLKTNIDINTSNANGLNALHLASKDGHVEIVEELLKRGAIVDAATKKGNTALHIASLAGQEEVVKLLVQHGASVNVQSQNGFTPLYMAAQENHDNVVKFLLANGANQSLSTEDGFTPLAVAMQQGHDKVVTVLLENDTRGKVRLPALHIAAKKDDVRAAKLLLENDHNPDVTSKSGFTPLHIASHYGNQPIANLLIQKGADVNYSAKHNITPLHVAAKWGKSNMVSLLLEQGAHIEARTRDGLTPLHCAARSGHEQVVDMLLEKSAPISSKTKNGLAPLHMAAQGDHVDAARILLYHRAPVDEVTVDYLTALHVAAHCGHVRVAKLLLDRQADANARALNGFTPLHIACKKNRIKVVELLLNHGACIGATTESGLTPLHVASFMGCMNIVIYLLQHDASPDIPTVRGETPLHLAARANQTDIIRILLRNGAQVDARAREQQTPLHVASRLGNVDIVMLLLQHGAKIDNTTKDMYTSLHIAAKEGQDEVAAVLIENGASLNPTTKKGFTPLHLASKYGHLKVAKLLVQKEAPVDAQGKNGVTPLHVASHYDHQNVALLLLEKGASPHAEAKNGHTPLHIAARKNQMDIANTLLEYGAKPDVESKAGFTPLHLSSQEGHVEISSLLLEHNATPDFQSKNGLTPMHLCAQENKVSVAELLHKNGAEIDKQTKGGYTPLHIASHYGQADMVKFLLSKGANVKATTSLGYTPLHQAAQQGHTNIVNLLLDNSAQPNAVTNNGQTPLHIAQKLGYITVIDTLKKVTETAQSPVSSEEKYRVVAPELMHETFLSDSEEEGEDTLLGDQTYRYLTADEMKSLGDDSLPIDVTRDERVDSNRMVGSDDPNAFPPRHIEDAISPEHIHPNYVEYIKKATDNVDLSRHPVNIGKLHWRNFLVSFLVDARGGAMRGCRHSGVRVIVPPRCAPSPTRITCRYVRPQRTPHPPPLMEGEALASRVLELGPVGAKFLGPVIIEVPHFAALRGKEREIVILRSDNGESWKEHTVEATEDVLNEVLRDSFEAEDLHQLEDNSSGRTTRIITQDFPQYFAVISRIRQEVHAIGPEGGMVSSTVVPQVQAVFPQGALTKKIKVGLQAQPIDPELTAKLLGHGVAVSPVVTVEPRRRKFHKAITLSMPAPRAHSQGMINQYSGSAPTLRLLCSITGGTSRAQWEDVTGSTPLTFVNDCVSFTTTVSARFWLMDCRNIGDATKMATELYREAIHVPFIAKFVVFAKRIDPLEARLRVFCMTDDKEDKTLEYQEQFTEIAKSRDVEVLEGKSQFIEFAGNLVPITKSGEQLQFSFRAFKENRLPFSVRVKDQHAEAVSRCLFMREPKVQKGEPPQQPICILNIVLPDDIVSETISLTDSDSVRKRYYANENFDYYRQDPRLADMSNLLGEDWVELANQLGLTSSEINVIKSEYPDSVAKQAQSMLRMWLSQSGNRVQTNTLENALRRIGRDDITNQCLNVDNRNQEILRIRSEEKEKHRLISENLIEDRPSQEKYIKEEKVTKTFSKNVDKYSAEEKTFEPSDEEEEDFNKSVPERREQIVKRLSTERTIPASSQRVEIVQEITSIKRQSLVEDKIAEVQQKANIEPMRITMVKPVSKIIQEKTISEKKESDITPHVEERIDKTQIDAQNTEKKKDPNINNLDNQEKPDRRDSVLLEEVTQLLETKKPVSKLANQEDPKSPKFSQTPPPSPADFIKEKQATTIQEWNAIEDTQTSSKSQGDTVEEDKTGKTTSTRFLNKLEDELLDYSPPSVAFPKPESNKFTTPTRISNASTKIGKNDNETFVSTSTIDVHEKGEISRTEVQKTISIERISYEPKEKSLIELPISSNDLPESTTKKDKQALVDVTSNDISITSSFIENEKRKYVVICQKEKSSADKEKTVESNEMILEKRPHVFSNEVTIIEKQDNETSKEYIAVPNEISQSNTKKSTLQEIDEAKLSFLKTEIDKHEVDEPHLELKRAENLEISKKSQTQSEPNERSEKKAGTLEPSELKEKTKYFLSDEIEKYDNIFNNQMQSTSLSSKPVKEHNQIILEQKILPKLSATSENENSIGRSDRNNQYPIDVIDPDDHVIDTIVRKPKESSKSEKIEKSEMLTFFKSKSQEEKKDGKAIENVRNNIVSEKIKERTTEFLRRERVNYDGDHIKLKASTRLTGNVLHERIESTKDVDELETNIIDITEKYNTIEQKTDKENQGEKFVTELSKDNIKPSEIRENSSHLNNLQNMKVLTSAFIDGERDSFVESEEGKSSKQKSEKTVSRENNQYQVQWPYTKIKEITNTFVSTEVINFHDVKYTPPNGMSHQCETIGEERAEINIDTPQNESKMTEKHGFMGFLTKKSNKDLQKNTEVKDLKKEENNALSNDKNSSFSPREMKKEYGILKVDHAPVESTQLNQGEKQSLDSENQELTENIEEHRKVLWSFDRILNMTDVFLNNELRNYHDVESQKEKLTNATNLNEQYPEGKEEETNPPITPPLQEKTEIKYSTTQTTTERTVEKITTDNLYQEQNMKNLQKNPIPSKEESSEISSFPKEDKKIQSEDSKNLTENQERSSLKVKEETSLFLQQERNNYEDHKIISTKKGMKNVKTTLTTSLKDGVQMDSYNDQNENMINPASTRTRDITEEFINNEVQNFHDVKYFVPGIESDVQKSHSTSEKTEQKPKFKKESRKRSGLLSFFKRKSSDERQDSESSKFVEKNKKPKHEFLEANQQKMIETRDTDDDDDTNERTETEGDFAELRKITKDFLFDEIKMYQDVKYSPEKEPRITNQQITQLADDKNERIKTQELIYPQEKGMNTIHQRTGGNDTVKTNISDETSEKVEKSSFINLFEEKSRKDKKEKSDGEVDKIEDKINVVSENLANASSSFLTNEKETYEDSNNIIERNRNLSQDKVMISGKQETTLTEIQPLEDKNTIISSNNFKQLTNEFLNDEKTYYEDMRNSESSKFESDASNTKIRHSSESSQNDDICANENTKTIKKEEKSGILTFLKGKFKKSPRTDSEDNSEQTKMIMNSPTLKRVTSSFLLEEKQIYEDGQTNFKLSTPVFNGHKLNAKPSESTAEQKYSETINICENDEQHQLELPQTNQQNTKNDDKKQHESERNASNEFQKITNDFLSKELEMYQDVKYVESEKETKITNQEISQLSAEKNKSVKDEELVYPQDKRQVMNTIQQRTSVSDTVKSNVSAETSEEVEKSSFLDFFRVKSKKDKKNKSDSGNQMENKINVDSGNLANASSSFSQKEKEIYEDSNYIIKTNGSLSQEKAQKVNVVISGKQETSLSEIKLSEDKNTIISSNNFKELTNEFLNDEKIYYEDMKYSETSKFEKKYTSEQTQNKTLLESVDPHEKPKELKNAEKNTAIQECSNDVSNTKTQDSSEINRDGDELSNESSRKTIKKREKAGILTFLKGKLKKGPKTDSEDNSECELSFSEVKHETSSFLLEEKRKYEDSHINLKNSTIVFTENKQQDAKPSENVPKGRNTDYEVEVSNCQEEDNMSKENNRTLHDQFKIGKKINQHTNVSNEGDMKFEDMHSNIASITQSFLDREKIYENNNKISNISTRRTGDKNINEIENEHTFKTSREHHPEYSQDWFSSKDMEITNNFLITEKQLYDFTTSDSHKISVEIDKQKSYNIQRNENLTDSISTSDAKQKSDAPAKTNKKRRILGFLKKKSKESEDFPTEIRMKDVTEEKKKKEIGKTPSHDKNSTDNEKQQESTEFRTEEEDPNEIAKKTIKPQKKPHEDQDIADSKKGILGFLFKKKKPKNKEETSTYHKADDFLEILENTKTFLHRETEMYHDTNREYSGNTSNMPHLTIEKPQNDINPSKIIEQKIIAEKVHDNTLPHTHVSFSDNVGTINESTEEEKINTVNPEYMAFDFIKEEIETFESTKAPNTSKIDSSIRIETEVETIDGESPKEIITKKIIISEKLIQKNNGKSDSSTSEEILRKLIDVNDELKAQLNLEEISESENKFQQVPEPQSTSSEKLEETAVDEIAEKIAAIELARSNIVEDVSVFEGTADRLKKEVVTDLDDITSDESYSSDSRRKKEIVEMLKEKYPEYYNEHIPIIEDDIVWKTVGVDESITEEKSIYLPKNNGNDESDRPKSNKKVTITKLNEPGTTMSSMSDASQVTEDLVTDLKMEYLPYTKDSKEDVTSGKMRKPIFRIESEEENCTAINEEDPDTQLNNLLRELQTNNEDCHKDTTLKKENQTEENKDEIVQSDIDILEKKLSELGKALDTLEQLNEVEPPKTNELRERKLRRVERKFERMASETIELSNKTSVDLSNSAESQQYQQLVSQLSQDEVMSFQGDFNNLLEEYTFSKSDEWDSKTPDSQADVLELPQGEIVYMAPVKLNVNHSVNKAGVEVDVIPIMPSPNVSPKAKKKRRRHRSTTCSNESQSPSPAKQHPHSYLQDSITKRILEINPRRFLSGTFINEENDSHFDENLWSTKSLDNISIPTGERPIMNAVVDWLATPKKIRFPFEFDSGKDSSRKNTKENCQLGDISSMDVQSVSLNVQYIGETSQPHEHSDTISSKDQQESSTEEGYGQMRQQPLDQHQLSSEMKELLKEMEEASKK
ncbi:uncharacterized protein LOC123672919 isoform X7 [Harmonia axyridis]|uniref:uncharacterized protein LOC123672919 isoform X7 n=1 Tax=Harmonia axyridis TaxID=115357 RepID=UPI001E2790B0|nr:uncharacterized protein LOC123672919 isoform X7 [Harmonia axyridis]